MQPHVPVAARVAGGLLGLVGVTNAAAGAYAVAAGEAALPLGLSVGLLLAGVITAVAARLVWRGDRRAALVGAIVFGVLLVVRLLSIGDATSTQRVSLLMLGVLEAALVAAVLQLPPRPAPGGRSG